VKIGKNSCDFYRLTRKHTSIGYRYGYRRRDTYVCMIHTHRWGLFYGSLALALSPTLPLSFSPAPTPTQLLLLGAKHVFPHVRQNDDDVSVCVCWVPGENFRGDNIARILRSSQMQQNRGYF